MFPQVKKPNGPTTPGGQMRKREAELLAEVEIPKGDKPKPIKKAAAEGELLAP